MKTTLFTLLFCSAAAVAAAATIAGSAAKTSDEMPMNSQVVSMVQPKYPIEMLRTLNPGYVRLDVAVDAKGRVVSVDVLTSSDQKFATESIRAVKQWRFVESTKPLADGHRHVEVPIRFVIADGIVAQR